MMMSIALAFVAAIKFLIDNNRRLKWLCKCLVNIQTALGMYEEDVYDFFKPSVIKKGLFPLEGKKWGEKGKYLNFWSHITLLTLFGLATIIFIWTSFN